MGEFFYFCIYSLVNRSANNITHSPWQSPVPYLFGGVAAMLALIAIALLILVCSHWKLSDHSGQGNSGGHDSNTASVESGEKNTEECRDDIEENVMVIMAWDERPTFLAKPAMSTTSEKNDIVC